MPTGSAASLPQPQVPLSPSFSARRRPGAVMVPGTWGATAPPRRSPVHAAAAEPPRGRVLLASNDPATAFELQRMLREAGYRAVGPAGSMAEVERLVAQRVRYGNGIDCAVVDLTLRDAARIAGRLADEGVRFLWLAQRGGVAMSGISGTPVLHTPLDRDALAAAIEGAIRSGAESRSVYSIPPPQRAWPRIFPQL